MRITEAALRRTIRRAILISEAKKKKKKKKGPKSPAEILAKAIKNYVNGQHEQNPIDAFVNCSPDALQAKFQEEGYSEMEIADAFNNLDEKDYLHRDGKKQWFQKPY